MITDALTGWLLHKRAIGNGCAHVTFFTQEQGLLRAHVQGGRTLKKQVALQPFTPLWLVFDERKYGTYIRQIEPTSASLTLNGQQVLAGLYVNELLYHALRPNEHEPLLFDAYEKAVHHLAEPLTRVALEGVLRRFEWALLSTSGSHVSYSHELDGLSLLVETRQYIFVPGEGFTWAESGLCGAYLLAMAEGKFDDPNVLKTAKFIMRRSIDHLLEGVPIRSRALYRGLISEHKE